MMRFLPNRWRPASRAGCCAAGHLRRISKVRGYPTPSSGILHCSEVSLVYFMTYSFSRLFSDYTAYYFRIFYI